MLNVAEPLLPAGLLDVGALHLGHWTTWFLTFGVCIVSALVPVVNAELVLLGAVALVPRRWAIPLAVAATLGQMTGKVVVYYVGKGALHLPGGWIKRAAAKAERTLTKREGMETTVYFVSAVFGVPPYYLVALASGMVDFPMARFVSLGLAGRFIRFSAIALFPGLLHHWLHWNWSIGTPAGP